MSDPSSDQLAAGNTLLTITTPGVPPYSARGLSQSLEPIDETSQLRRTINGDLKDLSVTQFRKYKSTISGDDQDPPAMAGMWPGRLLAVECISELCYMTANGSGLEERTVVDGSRRVDGDFTFYRPALNMRLVNYKVDTDEWGRAVSWSMDLEEA